MKWISGLFFLSTLCVLSSALHAEPKVYFAPSGKVSSVVICEESSYARVYAMLTDGVARMLFEKSTNTLENLKFALLQKSFVTSNPALRQEWFERKAFNPDKEDEIAFVQSEPAKFENNKATVKGQLVINDIRKDVSFEATLNKTGRISKNKDVLEDGTPTIGFSIHATIKRSDYMLNGSSENSAFNDEAILMLDIVAQ